jgi:hypothetical protein
VAIIELEGICPPRKIGIPTVSQYTVAENRRCTTVIRRLSLQVFFGPVHIVFRMIINPWVIQGSVVWNEIEEELQIMLPEPVPELEEGFVSSEIPVDCVSTDCKRRSRYGFFCKISQCCLVVFQKAGMLCGNFSACLSVVPHAQKPDPVATPLRNALQKSIRYLGEGGLAPKPPRDFTEPDARIDLKESGTGHDL